jgi:hypothetical protein
LPTIINSLVGWFEKNTPVTTITQRVKTGRKWGEFLKRKVTFTSRAFAVKEAKDGGKKGRIFEEKRDFASLRLCG